jgi:tRNA U34 5-carboxymethylaminomethyl modifying GTPase MnmE/TrmE
MLGGEDLDEALACALPSGEFELHVHGSPTLVRRLTGSLGTESVLRLGARPGAPACARPGAPACPRAEPQSIEERAALALASAPCEGAARILLDQAEGALTRELRSISAEPLERRDRAIDTLLSRWSVARMALEPAEVVIAGPVNAGKSTLFNALLGERRAIVGPETGTTRDRLRARALLGQWPAWISDTAGGLDPSALASASPVDREGQERARRARGSADLVLWLDPLDPSRPPAKPPSREPPPHEWGRRAILVHTFADLVERTSRTSGALSALRDPAGGLATGPPRQLCSPD